MPAPRQGGTREATGCVTLFPFLAWLVPAASLVMLFAEMTEGELGRGLTVTAVVVFVTARRR